MGVGCFTCPFASLSSVSPCPPSRSAELGSPTLKYLNSRVISLHLLSVSGIHRFQPSPGTEDPSYYPQYV
jgi:hypothetical protein